MESYELTAEEIEEHGVIESLSGDRCDSVNYFSGNHVSLLKAQNAKTLRVLDDMRLLKHDSKYGNPLFVCLPDCRVCALLREMGVKSA